jgi:uncharacterized protein YjaZ
MALHLDFFEPAVAGRRDPDAAVRLRAFLERVLHRVDRQVAPLLPLAERITVAAGVDPARTVRETGIGVRAWASDRIDLWIDPAHPWVDAAGEEELVAVLAHALHHCARRRRPGFGRTLGEALVSEGLGCLFETGFRGGVPPFWARALDKAALHAAMRQAGAALDACEFDRQAWFGGRPDQALPRHAGHSLGFHLVAFHARATGRTAAQLVHAPAATILASSFVAAAA